MKINTGFKGLSCSFCGLLALLFLVQCSSKPKNKAEVYVQKIWRINPTSTVLNKATQVFISGKDLDTMKISTGKTVVIERGKVSGKGTKQQLLITVSPFIKDKGSKYKDEPGKREIWIHTDKKPEKLFLNILDEDPISEIKDVDHL